MKKIFLSLAITMIATLATFAQVPTVMMYQVQIIHGKEAYQDVSVEIQLRTSQSGSAIWSQTFNLTGVKNRSVQNLGLDFGDKVDLSIGEYWLATIIDGEEKGCAKLTSVPYAFVAKTAMVADYSFVAKTAMEAKTLEGVLTAEELIGTWYTSDTDGGETIEIHFAFNNDGSFTYLYINSYPGEPDIVLHGSGIWKLNSVGSLYVKGTRNGRYEENVVRTYFDRANECLTIGAGDSEFFGDACTLTKEGNKSETR